SIRIDDTHPASSTVKTISKRSRFLPLFLVVTGPIAIVGSDYINTKSLPLREANPMPRAAERNEPFRFRDTINGGVVLTSSPVGASEPAFFCFDDTSRSGIMSPLQRN